MVKHIQYRQATALYRRGGVQEEWEEDIQTSQAQVHQALALQLDRLLQYMMAQGVYQPAVRSGRTRVQQWAYEKNTMRAES
jgi:hypothetical protein